LSQAEDVSIKHIDRSFCENVVGRGNFGKG
jgi:hypothetical protein